MYEIFYIFKKNAIRVKNLINVISRIINMYVIIYKLLIKINL